MRIRDFAAPVSAARSEGLLIEHVGDETVIYDLESKEAHCLRAIAAFVFANADGDRSVAEIAKMGRERLGLELPDEDVLEAVEQLEDIDLLTRPMVVLEDGLSRRQMVKRVAYTGAAAVTATTMVTTIAAPNALAARIPAGGTSADIEITEDEPPADDFIVGLLRDVLLAQYEWTSAVFGLVP